MWFELGLLALFVLILLLTMLPVWRNVERYYLTQELKKHPELTTAQLPLGIVNYRLTGGCDLPVVVLVHGFSVPSFAWERNAKAIEHSGFRVLTFDLYGRGYSARPNRRYNLELFSSQLNQLLDHLHLDQTVHLVGLSLGGAIVSNYAQLHPERVASVSLFAPLNEPVNIGPLKLPVIGRYLTYAFYLPNMIQKQLKDLVEPELLEHWQQRYQDQMRIKGFRNAIYLTANHALQQSSQQAFESLNRNQIPTLLIWGRKDKLLSFEQSDNVRSYLPINHTFVALEDAGHALQYEKSEIVNKALISFLRGLPDKKNRP
ncbi:putative hydrolase, alpha/beta fold protein [Vibrio inusitatus NBRC 102082]|uniref:Putative hydrolase, alpha/beta fold protein n=1 Tax=Vibrio inusitatus NBRC 102082 TaxID=1219070 RepID=A0A4Y3HT03_9VIBR|nr:alpha/beta hydrolase [Vibrio inusitatus]GEA50145.1 putative hydrolase, alpha/beta fold protein [Vibrio inusitatus NBRC 102082]